MRIARTSADLDESKIISEGHLLEAVDLRKYGDGDFFGSVYINLPENRL
jgi:predicted ATPase with chaperone activity